MRQATFPTGQAMSIVEEKAAARAAAKARRDAAHARLAASAPAYLLSHFVAAVSLPPGSAVSGYWPGRSELDVRPLLEWLDRAGHRVALPVVLARGQPLLFRRWRPGGQLEARPFALMEPPTSAPALVPKILLVPFLAVDAEGYRIGYGAGYYDMTLARLRQAGPVLAIGVGYEAQRVERLPHDARDEPLDWVVTEAGAVRFAAIAGPHDGPERQGQQQGPSQEGRGAR
jgi:5-formyltetrahydrofolate cyclo-ligase